MITTLGPSPISLSPIVDAKGQCQLQFVSTTQIKLVPMKGRFITIGGKNELVPSAGVILANTGLTAATKYYVYAYMLGATMTLEASTTGHSTDSATGVEVKTSAPSRTFVGMVQMDDSGLFQDTTKVIGVLSYFNRRGKAILTNFTVGRSTQSTTYVELNTEIRANFLTWGDEAVSVGVNAVLSVTTGVAQIAQAIAFDSATNQDGGAMSAIQPSGTGIAVNGALTLEKSGLTEGFHFATLLGAINIGADTANWSGGSIPSGSTVSNVTTLCVRVRG